MDYLGAVYGAVLLGEMATAVAQTEAALAAGVDPNDILNDCIAAMAEVGDRFEAGEMFVPEMLIAARAMKAVMAILKPLLVQAGLAVQGKVILGTVAGDMHDIGKNLVGMMLEGAGFSVVDLGTNVTVGEFVTAVQQHRPDVIGLSALLTTTMPMMRAVIDGLCEAGLRENVKVIIGGAPVTREYAEEVTADGFAKDAAAAPRLVKSLLGM